MIIFDLPFTLADFVSNFVNILALPRCHINIENMQLDVDNRHVYISDGSIFVK